MALADDLDGMPMPRTSPADRLRQALDMWDEGVAIQRLNLQRRNPGLTEEELDREMARWLAREQ